MTTILNSFSYRVGIKKREIIYGREYDYNLL